MKVRKEIRQKQEASVSAERQIEIAKEIDERIKRGDYR